MNFKILDFIFQKLDISNRNKKIIFERFINNKTYSDIAKQFNISRGRVQQIVINFWRNLNGTLFKAEEYKGKNKILKEKINKINKLQLYNPDNISRFFQNNFNNEIEKYDFSIRVQNCFYKKKIRTIKQLIQMTKKELLKMDNLGKESLNEIIDVLNNNGFSLKED